MEQTAFRPFLDVQGDSGEGGRNGLCSILQLLLLVLFSPPTALYLELTQGEPQSKSFHKRV